MKTAKRINSLIITCLCISLVCCKNNTNRKEKKSIPIKDTITKVVYNYDNIVTNKRKEGFDWNLIDSLPVRENDTVLFREVRAMEL